MYFLILRTKAQQLHETHQTQNEKMQTFKNKVVVITGAASGIGKALALVFAKAVSHLALNDFDEKYRPDIYRFSKIIALVIHYELGNLQILPYLAQSAVLHFKTRNKLFQSESLLLQFFKKAPQAHFSKKKKELLQETLNELRRILEAPKEQYILLYFDFVSWLESQLERKSFATLKRQKNKG